MGEAVIVSLHYQVVILLVSVWIKKMQRDKSVRRTKNETYKISQGLIVSPNKVHDQ